LLFTLQGDLHLKTPDGEVQPSFFLVIGYHRSRAREFGHASRLHGSGYKSTGLNHRVGHARGEREDRAEKNKNEGSNRGV
jgi:hypothetical protein